MQNNQTRFEFTANVEDLQIATDRLKELKALQISLAQEAQRGEKTISEAIKAQTSARKEQLQIEGLLREANKANANEQKQALAAITAAQQTLNASQSRTLGLLEEERAKLKSLKTAREQAQSTTEVEKYNTAIKESQTQINKLTGATDKFRGSNGFWQETRQLIVSAFAINTIVDWTGKMFSASSQIESFKNSLNRLVGEGQATKIFTDLSKAIVNTPLEFEGATKQIEKLIFAYQDAGKSTQNIVKDFLAVGNVAKGIPENVQGITKALADTASAGKASAQEFNQFSNAGVNLFQLLSESTGKNRQELLKWREDGKISFDLVQQAILKAGSEGGRFFGAMDTQSQTTAGRLSSFKDAVFFALGNVGKQFDSTAKSVLSFGTSIINTLFGTEEQAKKTISVITTLVGAFGLYKAAAIANIAVQKSWLVLKGQTILATEAYIGMTIAETEAQIAATTAARSFNATLAANPLGIIALAIGSVVAGYQLYTSSVEESQVAQKKLNTDITSAIAPIMTQKEEFNNLAKSVLNTVLPLNEQEKVLERLKIQHPILLKGVQDLTTAEKILNENKIKTNTTLDYRNGKLDELKLKYPQQLKGIKTLEEAEDKLAGVVRITNRDFSILTATMENNIRMQAQLAGANDNFSKKIEAQNELLKLQRGQFDQMKNLDFFSNIIKGSKSHEEAIKSEIKAYDNKAKEFSKSAEVIRGENARLANEIVFKEAKTQKELTDLGKGGSEKRAKEKIDSEKTTNLLIQKEKLDHVNKTRQNEQAILKIQQTIDIQRVNDSIKSATLKAQEITKINTKFFVDSAKLTDKYDDEEQKQIDTQNKQKVKLRKSIHDYFEKIDNEYSKKQTAEEKKTNAEKLKLEEENIKKVLKLRGTQIELMDKLRYLDRISHAKNLEDIERIEKEEKERILIEEKDNANKILTIQRILYAQIVLLHGANSNEAKRQAGVVIDAEKVKAETVIAISENESQEKIKLASETGKYTISIINGVAEYASKNVSGISEQFPKIVGNAINAIKSFQKGDFLGGSISVFTTLFNFFVSIGDKAIAIQQARREKAAQDLRVFVEATTKEVDKILARFEDIKNAYGELKSGGGVVKDIVFNINLESALNGFRTFIDLADSFDNIVKNSGISIADLIDGEITRGQQIQSNYEKAVDNAEKLYDKNKDIYQKQYDKQVDLENKTYDANIKTINDTYDANIKAINDTYDFEIKRINDKYDYESTRATQQYNAQTLAITAAGTAQLEALITNESSLASVRKEFSDKRIEIEKAFPLASKIITEGMSEAEITAVNASIAARDAALAKLQAGYNTELATIVNAEGQKRKEYSATELIQIGIQAKLDVAALKFQGEEIQRTKDRADAIAKADEVKNTSIEISTKAHNANLQQIKGEHDAVLLGLATKLADDLLLLETGFNVQIAGLVKAKDKAIADSFEILTRLLTAQSEQIGLALQNSADKGSEAYKALEQQLERVNNLLNQIKNGAGGGGITIPSFDFDFLRNLPKGFAEGTERVPAIGRGVDKHIIAVDDNERILKGTDNNKLRSHFGKDIKNEDLVRIATTQIPKFVNYSITPTGNINELVSREMRVQVNMQLDGMKKAFENNSASVVKAINEKAETAFFADGNGFHKTTRKNNMSINEKISNYFG